MHCETRLSPEERTLVASRPTANGEAHDLYLRARSAWSLDDPDAAIALMERAAQLDPDFALAFVALSSFHRRLYFQNVDPSPERLTMAKQAVDRALELDPDLPEAHLALGRYYYNGHRDYRRALAEYEIARQGLPNEPPLYNDLGREPGELEVVLGLPQPTLGLAPAILHRRVVLRRGRRRGRARSSRWSVSNSSGVYTNRSTPMPAFAIAGR